MNMRQERYKTNRIMGMTIADAARAAGYSKSTIHSKAYRIERRLEVGITEELERAGLTAKVQAQALAELTQAKKNQVCDLYIQKDENGKWKINENMSQFVEVEDNTIRLKAWEHIANLKGQGLKHETHVAVNVKTPQPLIIIRTEIKKDEIGRNTTPRIPDASVR